MMARLVRLLTAAALLLPLSVRMAPAGEYDGYADHDGDDDQHRGEDQMMRQQQKERNTDEFDDRSDRSERAQEREERIEQKQERREDENENGGAGIRQFFKGSDE